MPVATIIGLMRRMTLSAEDRLTMASFALRRGLFAEAKDELEKLLNTDPALKASIAPLLEAAEKGLKGAAPAPAPAPGKAEEPVKPPEKKD